MCTYSENQGCIHGAAVLAESLAIADEVMPISLGFRTGICMVCFHVRPAVAGSRYQLNRQGHHTTGFAMFAH